MRSHEAFQISFAQWDNKPAPIGIVEPAHDLIDGHKKPGVNLSYHSDGADSL
jgi:hypothetical protein